jgi:hypothetical protein
LNGARLGTQGGARLGQDIVRVSGFLTSAGTGLPTSAIKTIKEDYIYKQTRKVYF